MLCYGGIYINQSLPAKILQNIAILSIMKIKVMSDNFENSSNIVEKICRHQCLRSRRKFYYFKTLSLLLLSIRTFFNMKREIEHRK